MSTYTGHFPVKYGDTGEMVRTIQENLNFLSHNFSVIPKMIPADDFFSKSMETSVRSFQKNFGLEETGVVDEPTWSRISKYYLEASKLAGAISAAKCITEKSAENITENEIQNALNVISYFNPYIKMTFLIEKDNVLLSQNVRNFQRYYGIKETGETDEITKNKLSAIFNIIMKHIPERYYCGGSVPFQGNILKYGSKGSDVMRLQSYLRIISASIREIQLCDITGEFDGRTMEAVKSYQKLYGIYPDGVVGPITWNGIAKLSDFFSSDYCIL